jgi:hypothetical protein
MSCCSFAANTVRLQLHAPAYNLANFMRTLALPETGTRLDPHDTIAVLDILVSEALNQPGKHLPIG